jgi:aspartate ammonia-lyase
VNLGGTAIGTGLNAPAGYAESARGHLEDITGLEVRTAQDLVAATQDIRAFVRLSSTMRQVAVRCSKLCNDLRLLASGPDHGFSEITLPAVQAGSSMMPGKVNPVIPEAFNQVAFSLIGSDVAVGMAAEAGQLQLNAFEPLMAHLLFSGLHQLAAASEQLAHACVDGIRAASPPSQGMQPTVGLATMLTPAIGYAAAASVVREARDTGGDVVDILEARGLMERDVAVALLDAGAAQAGADRSVAT